jgi:hypothetical protein
MHFDPEALEVQEKSAKVTSADNAAKRVRKYPELEGLQDSHVEKIAQLYEQVSAESLGLLREFVGSFNYGDRDRVAEAADGLVSWWGEKLFTKLLQHLKSAPQSVQKKALEQPPVPDAFLIELGDIRRSLYDSSAQPGQDVAVQQHVGSALAELDSAYNLLKREWYRTLEEFTALP